MTYYPREEQETFYNFSLNDSEWLVESTYPPHIKRIKERCVIKEEEIGNTGNIIRIVAIAESNQVRVFNNINKPITGIDEATLFNLNRRAEKLGLPASLTLESLKRLWRRFNQGCALTGDKSISFDHVIPMTLNRAGSEIGNIIPLRRDLNSSKSDRNIFDWFAENKERYNLEQRRFDELIAYLADINDMTTEEYEEYVRWCHDNPRTLDEIKAEEEDDEASA